MSIIVCTLTIANQIKALFLIFFFYFGFTSFITLKLNWKMVWHPLLPRWIYQLAISIHLLNSTSYPPSPFCHWLKKMWACDHFSQGVLAVRSKWARKHGDSQARRHLDELILLFCWSNLSKQCLHIACQVCQQSRTRLCANNLDRDSSLQFLALSCVPSASILNTVAFTYWLI